MDSNLIPGSVTGSGPRLMYGAANDARVDLKRVAMAVDAMRDTMMDALTTVPAKQRGDAAANIVIAFRAIEDASMRLGKVMQALDGGISVYDKQSVVGAPGPCSIVLDLGTPEELVDMDQETLDHRIQDRLLTASIKFREIITQVTK